MRFGATDLTEEDRELFKRFGEPWIQFQGASKPLTKMSDWAEGVFDSEEEARKYEEEVLARVGKEMDDLRRRRDDFTSSEEFVV